MSLDLIATAKRLTEFDGRARQHDLRRAISTAYYAMFHELARQSADILVGGRGATKSESAWHQVYRSLEHRSAKSACKDASSRSFPAQIQDFADSFVQLQERRHEADYDPTLSFLRNDAILTITTAEVAIRKFRNSRLKHRRAFAVWVLFKRRH